MGVYWRVGRYSIYQEANRYANRRATIYLHEDLGDRMAILYFMGETSLPENEEKSDKSGKKRYYLYFPFDEFSTMMQMLREQQPIYFQYDSSKSAAVSTSIEAVGEADIK